MPCVCSKLVPSVIGFSILLSPLYGCWTSQQIVQYQLVEPTAPLVYEMVRPGDELEITLKNGSRVNMIVAEVQGGAIRGESGAVIQASEIREITCIDTLHDPTWITELGAELILAPAAQTALVLSAPVSISAAWAHQLGQMPIDEWPDDQLCRVSNRPDDYRSIWDANSDDKSGSTVEMIRAEVSKRNLDGDPTRVPGATAPLSSGMVRRSPIA